MFDTRSFLYCHLFFIIRSAFLGFWVSGFLVFFFFFFFTTSWQDPSDDVAGVAFSRPGLFGAGFRQSTKKPEEAGLQHSKVYIFFLSAFWVHVDTSFGHEVYAFDAFSSLSCDANLYCNDFILLRCL